jgi:hypothetical protein
MTIMSTSKFINTTAQYFAGCINRLRTLPTLPGSVQSAVCFRIVASYAQPHVSQLPEHSLLISRLEGTQFSSSRSIPVGRRGCVFSPCQLLSNLSPKTCVAAQLGVVFLSAGPIQ